LEGTVGRSEVRVVSAAYEIPIGATAGGADLAGRLKRLGYARVRHKPTAPGEFFWGHERFWIYQRSHRRAGRSYPAALNALDLRKRDGRILGISQVEGSAGRGWIEPEILAESLTDARAPRRPLRFKDLPERVWRPLLAAEDHRFFEHAGLDARGIARAMLRNAKAGKVVQGGSTITQQLIKTRDLTSKRTLGRKVSEAVRALELEAEHDKEEILQAYLNHVYFGHLDGVTLYGFGAASRAFFSKRPQDLTLGEAALLAGMVQGPNRLSPIRNPERALARQRLVLQRMEELEWASKASLRRAREAGLPTIRRSRVRPAADRRLVAWLREITDEEAPRRLSQGRGVILETTLDPYLQEAAEDLLEGRLESLRKGHRRLRGKPLSAALVTIDATSGAVLAAVAGDPRNRKDAFDRVRTARRQPGSAVKPLVLLEAFESCGGREPLYPARQVLDRAIRLPLPSGPWEPQNNDGRFRGPVSLREATVTSLNVPFVRIARWCGFEATAQRLRRVGLPMPKEAPPALVLGAVETSPLELAQAYATFATLGRTVEASPVYKVLRPSGRTLSTVLRKGRGKGRRVVDPASAYLVRDLLEDIVARGTGRGAQLEGVTAWGKTGTSSDRRDAWFIGGAGNLVTAVWVGIDDGAPLGLTGSAAALPLWKNLMEKAAASYPSPNHLQRPDDIVEHWIEERSGLLLRKERRGATQDLFRRRHTPPRRRLLRPDDPVPVLQ